MGAFIGCLPVYGLHLAIILILSLRLRLDGALAYLAANISNPFVAPFIVAAQVHVGAIVLDGAAPDFAADGAIAHAISSSPKYLAVGAPIVSLAIALPLGALGFVVTVLKRRFVGDRKRIAYTLPPSAPPWVIAVEETARRFAPDDDRSPAARARFNYVRIKMLTDPVARMIADDLEKAPVRRVLDIGTGRGQLPMLLVALGRAESARGIDWDAAKIDEGSRAVSRAPAVDVELERGDARTATFDEADVVLLIDLLHYFTLDEQDAILKRAASAVRPGGRLLVREADTERGWRSFVTLLEEKVFTLAKWNRGERVCFRPAREIAALLEREGMTVAIEKAWGKTPFSNVLIVGRRA
jgi:SAM-dependent methyltransferase